MKRWWLTLLGVSSLAAVAVFSHGESEREIAIEMVPIVVMDAAQMAVPGFVAEEAEEVTVERGMIYELEGSAEGVSHELKIAVRARVISVESGDRVEEVEDDDHADDDEDGEEDDD